jgi:hypothetical protein
MSMPSGGEEEATPELVRSDEYLANPSDPTSIPTAASQPEVLIARHRMHAMVIRMRVAIRRAFTLRPPSPLVIEDTVVLEDNLADNPVNPVPTIDSSPLIIRRPHQADPEDTALRPDQTKVWVGLRVLETLEVMVGFITSRASLVRAFVYLVVVTAAFGTVALLSAFIPDVPDPVLACSLWGLLILLVGGPVLGIGLWFVDKKHDHDDKKPNHRDS